MSEAESHRTIKPFIDSSASTDKSFTLGRFALALAILLFISFPDVLTGRNSFYTRDFSSFGYPLAYQVQQCYRAGELPLWNPYSFTGLPFLAQWNTLCFYPPSLIYILLPLPWSLNLFNLLHLYLGGLSMFCLARRWLTDGRAASVAGVAYAFGGVMLSALMWPNNIAALGWLPVVLLVGERAVLEGGRRWVLAALVLAMQFLTGAPEIVAMTWVGLTLIALFGQDAPSAITHHASGVPSPPSPTIHHPLTNLRVSMRLGVIFLTTLGLVAIQLLPFLELLKNSQRETGYATGNWTLTWTGLGNFLVPLFRTVKDRDEIYFQWDQHWITSYYGGATILLLTLIGLFSDRSRRLRVLALLGLLSLTMALGSHGGLYNWLREFVPGLGVVRYPIKFIVPVAVLLPLFAGYGTRAWLNRQADRRLMQSLVTALALASLALMTWSHWRPLTGENVALMWLSGSISLVCVIAFWRTAHWWLRVNSTSLSHLLALTLMLLVYFDLFLANRQVNPVAPTKFMNHNLADLNPRPALGAARAMVSSAAHQLLDATIFPTAEVAVKVPRQSLMLNANLLERVPKLDGFYSLYLPRPAAVVAHLALQTNSPGTGLMDFLGVSHVSDARKPWQWNQRTNWLPLLTLAPRAIFLDRTDAFLRLFTEEFKPGEHVLLPKELMDRITAPGTGRGKITSQRVVPHRIEATVELTQPMFAVLAQANYAGWRAKVDGQPVPLWTANYAFQALEVPAGEHRVEVYFHSTSFQMGAIVTALSLTGCLIYLWRCRRD